MKKFLLLLLTVTVFYNCSNPYESGVERYKKGYYSLAINDLKKVEKDDPNYKEAQKYLDLAQKAKQQKMDSLILVEKQLKEKEAAEKIIKDIEEAKIKLNAINTIENNLNHSDVLFVVSEAQMYDSYAYNAKKYKESNNEELKQLGAKIEAALKRKQKIRFPKLRKSYIELMKKKLWANDFKVKGSNYNRNITFINGYFAANQQILNFHKEIRETLHTLRFKRVNYKWIPSAQEYSYYDLKPEKDTFVN